MDPYYYSSGLGQQNSVNYTDPASHLSGYIPPPDAYSHTVYAQPLPYVPSPYHTPDLSQQYPVPGNLPSHTNSYEQSHYPVPSIPQLPDHTPNYHPSYATPNPQYTSTTEVDYNNLYLQSTGHSQSMPVISRHSQSYSSTPMTELPPTLPPTHYEPPVITHTQLTEEEIAQQKQLLESLGFTMSPDYKPHQDHRSFEIDVTNLAEMLLEIQLDPRYRRLLFKIAPPKTNVKGLIQYGKTKVDPSHIPGFGFIINSSRLVEYGKHNKEFVQYENNAIVSENMTEDVRQAIQGGLEAQMTKQAVKMAVGAVLNWVPIFKLLPTGELVKIASYKTAEKAVNKRSRTDGLEGAALKDFKHTKAFLLYVGLPPDPDPLYSTWEEIRLNLKQYFGETREANLYIMSSVWKEFKYVKEKEAEEQAKQGNHDSPISMLLMLWHVYNCWDEPYFDRLVRLKEKISVNVLKKDALLSLDERNRLKDQMLLGFDGTYERDPHIKLASIEYLDSIVQVLVNQFLNSQKFAYLHRITGVNERPESKLEIVFYKLVKHFIEKYQVWVYVEEDYAHTVRAVALVEPPGRQEPALPLSKMTRLALAKAIGREFNKVIFADLKKDFELRKTQYNSFQCDSLVIHLFGFWHEPENVELYHSALTVLLYELTQSTLPNVPVYAQTHPDQRRYLEELGFTPLPNQQTSNPSNSIGYLYVRDN